MSPVVFLAPVIVLLGPPGAGKSTQAEKLAKAHGWPTISAGDLLRAEAARDTPLGQRLKATMAQGELVDDDTVNRLVGERMSQPDCKNGFLLDGYPRALAQARHLDELLAARGQTATILHIDVPDEVLVVRLSGRRRSDDSPEVVRRRLSVYRAETQPIVDFYRSRPGYHLIRGDRSRAAVFDAIELALRFAQ